MQEDKDTIGKRTSYYVEENEKILNLLISNCEPILTEIVTQINHFNTYNKIDKVVEKSGVNIDEISIQTDCVNIKTTKIGQLQSNKIGLVYNTQDK